MSIERRKFQIRRTQIIIFNLINFILSIRYYKDEIYITWNSGQSIHPKIMYATLAIAGCKI